MVLFQTHRDSHVSGEAICLPSTGIKEGCITTQTPKVGFKYFKPFKDYNTNVYKVQGKHHMSVKTNYCITIAAARSLHMYLHSGLFISMLCLTLYLLLAGMVTQQVKACCTSLKRNLIPRAYIKVKGRALYVELSDLYLCPVACGHPIYTPYTQ